jgi:hypothetical protein
MVLDVVQRSWPRIAAGVLAAAIVTAIVAIVSTAPVPIARATQAPGVVALAAGTPVAEDDEAGDPLDGDPLDGPPRGDDPGAPDNLTDFEIARSGRPADAPESLTAYDDDHQTIWSSEGAPDAWVWFDLGAERRLREVRWLARGAGTVEVAISDDREEWRTVGERESRGGWEGLPLREDARYVRLRLMSEESAEPLALAEVAAYGRDRHRDVELAQDAENEDRRQRNRNRERDDRQRDRAAARDEERIEVRDRAEERSEDRPGISAEPGETRCEGRRARCRTEAGRVSVEDDCQTDGECVIDVRADGGTAVCDASAGDDSEAGRGNGRRGGDGGECEAVANGGAVTIGDVDP